MKCSRCDYDNLAGSQFCEKCGHNLAGIKIRPNLEYVPQFRKQSPTISKDNFGGVQMRPTPAPRPIPAGMPAPSAERVSVPAPAPRPVPVGSNSSAVSFNSAQSPTANSGAYVVTAPPTTVKLQGPQDILSAEDIALRSRAYGAFESTETKTVFYIDKEESNIGRTLDNEVVLEALPQGNSVSRHHARLIRQDEGVFLEDIGSSNGTFVNGETLIPNVQKQLYDNDQVRFGGVKLIFHWRQKG